MKTERQQRKRKRPTGFAALAQRAEAIPTTAAATSARHRGGRGRRQYPIGGSSRSNKSTEQRKRDRDGSIIAARASSHDEDEDEDDIGVGVGVGVAAADVGVTARSSSSSLQSSRATLESFIGTIVREVQRRSQGGNGPDVAATTREVLKRLGRPLQMDNAKAVAPPSHSTAPPRLCRGARVRPNVVVKELRERRITLAQLRPLHEAWCRYATALLRAADAASTSPIAPLLRRAHAVAAMDVSFARLRIHQSPTCTTLQGSVGIIVLEALREFVLMLEPHGRLVHLPKRGAWFMLLLPDGSSAELDGTAWARRREGMHGQDLGASGLTVPR